MLRAALRRSQGTERVRCVQGTRAFFSPSLIAKSSAAYLEASESVLSNEALIVVTAEEKCFYIFVDIIG